MIGTSSTPIVFNLDTQSTFWRGILLMLISTFSQKVSNFSMLIIYFVSSHLSRRQSQGNVRNKLHNKYDISFKNMKTETQLFCLGIVCMKNIVNRVRIEIPNADYYELTYKNVARDILSWNFDYIIRTHLMNDMNM